MTDNDHRPGPITEERIFPPMNKEIPMPAVQPPKAPSTPPKGG
ncbi:MAG: hypothetical protein ACD_39C02124G0001 [uncultured bacterium]|nr:MAG: hypothetical protein ACD_39C02124G0001 [uncultured bacterium]